MNNDLSQAVNKLRALAPQLNSAVEEAHRVVQTVERFLNTECQLGVEAEIPVTYNDKGKAILLLRYGPIDGAYRIGLINSDGESRVISRPWVNSDRCEKLTSFPALPKLLMAVAKAVETQIASTSATVATVSQIMSALAQPVHRGEVHTLPDLAILLQQPSSSHKSNGRPVDRRLPVDKQVEGKENGRPGSKHVEYRSGTNGAPVPAISGRQ